MNLGETAKAREYVRRAVKLGKQEGSYGLLINILTAEGDLRTAVSVCNSAVE